MTRLSLLRRLALAGVCAAAIGTGGVLLPATAFALPVDCGTQTSESCFGGGGSGGYSGGTGMIPPATVPIEEQWAPRPACYFDRELGRRVCD